MKLLITGVAGFIGSKIAARALEQGHEVYGVDDLSKGYESNIPAGVHFIKLDLSDKSRFHELPRGVDAIMHLAGQSSGEISFDDPVADLEKNTVSTLNLIEYGIATQAKRIVYASSMSVYGGVADADKPVTETTPCAPLSCYGVGKMASEKYLEIFKDKLPYTAFRMFSVYGPGQDLTNLRQGMVSIFLQYALEQGQVPVKGSLKRFRDFVYIDDVVDAWLGAIQNDRAANQVFNLGTGVKTTLESLLENMKKFVPDTTWTEVAGTPGDQFGVCADTSKFKSVFDTKNFKSLNDGLQIFVQSCKQ
jgi:UDP-glucose 4-epimerase